MRLKLISVAVALAVHTAVATAAPAREGNTGGLSDSLPQLGSDRGDAGTEVSASERLEAELAGLVADAGAALEEDGMTVDELLYERAQQEASSYVTGAVSSGIEGWLGSYGRAQVTLGTGYEGDLSWGIDYMQPLYRGQASALLYALGSHKLDGRVLADAGVIYRFGLGESTMLGTNLFVDQDLEHDHTRASVGLEVMAPWWQMSGNYYAPVSDWRDAGQNLKLDFADAETALQERPASGYDLSLQGGLPMIPQLSGEATVTRWTGDHIDVAGGEQTTESDPFTTELTVNYQPVPLVTVSATRAFLPGKDDTSVRMGLNFNLDQSLAQQLQPVTGASLFGGAPDMATRFVNRNYRMVMDYKVKAEPMVNPIGRVLRMHTDDTRIATGDPRAASSINNSPIAQSRWKGELGDTVVVMTTVRDDQERPVAGVPVIWHLTTTKGGEHHGQIVTSTGPAAPRGYPESSHAHVLAGNKYTTALSDTAGRVYLRIKDDYPERLQISAEVKRDLTPVAAPTTPAMSPRVAPVTGHQMIAHTSAST